MSTATVLMYHSLGEARSEEELRYCCSPKLFARQMQWLRASGYRVLPLRSVVRGVTGLEPLPPQAVAITFDDGFADFREHAVPILTRNGFPATVFVVSGYIGHTNEWMQARGFPARPLLSAPALRELSAHGIEVGSHTRTHPRLDELVNNEVEAELRDSRKALEDILGSPVRYFAYPYGRFNDAVRKAVSETYEAACSTRSGFNRRGDDHYAIRRLEIRGGDSLWTFRQKLRFGAHDANAWFALTYYGRRLASRLGLSN